jgi:hypothetical protein
VLLVVGYVSHFTNRLRGIIEGQGVDPGCFIENEHVLEGASGKIPMRISLNHHRNRRFVQRILFTSVGVLLCLWGLSQPVQFAQAAQAPTEDSPRTLVTIIKEVFRQMDGVVEFTAQAIGAVLSNTVRADQPPVTFENSELPEPLPIVSTTFPLAGVGLGTLVINAPLSVTNTLTSTGESQFASTTVSGLFTGGSARLQSLTVAGFGSFNSLRARTLSIQGNAELQSLSVLGEAKIGSLVIADLLQANGGIETSGADIQLGAGSVFASNLVYEVQGGTGVTVKGSVSSPVISFDGVLSVNGERGRIEFDEGDDIDISNLRISNESTLSSVRARGGCTGCILDADVSNALTIISGTINDTVIGSTTASSAFFTDVTVGTTTATTSRFTVLGSATSTFGSTINIESGCFSIGGVCVASAAAASSTYTGLSDTPNTLIANAVQFINGGASAVTQSANFVFDGSSLGVGTSTPSATLTVDGATLLAGALTLDGNLLLQDQQSIRWYDADSSNYVGFRSPATLAGDVTWTLPSTDGGVDEILVTDGSGALRFATIGSVGGIATYLDLTDTPSLFATSSIPFVNASGTALTQSSSFRFDGTYLGIGATAPSAELSVDGAVNFLASDGVIDVVYDDTIKKFGVGTDSPTEKFTLNQGSFLQMGGSAADSYSPVLIRSVSLGSTGRDIEIFGE